MKTTLVSPHINQPCPPKLRKSGLHDIERASFVSSTSGTLISSLDKRTRQAQPRGRAAALPGWAGGGGGVMRSIALMAAIAAVAAAAPNMPGAPRLATPARHLRPFTHADEERLAAAAAKRDRKAARNRRTVSGKAKP